VVGVDVDSTDYGTSDGNGAVSTAGDQVLVATGDRETILNYVAGAYADFRYGTDSGTTSDRSSYTNGFADVSAGVGADGSVTTVGENGEVTVTFQAGAQAEAAGGFRVSKNAETGDWELKAFGNAGLTLFEVSVQSEGHTQNNEINASAGAVVKVAGGANGAAEFSNTYAAAEGGGVLGLEVVANGGFGVGDDTLQVDGEAGVIVGLAVGVGANGGITADNHLKFGISGKLALGIGVEFSLSFDLDLNKVTDIGQAIADGLKKAGVVIGAGLGDLVGKIGNGLKDFGQDFVNGLKNFGEDFYNFFKQYGQEAVDAIRDYGQVAIDAIKEFGVEAFQGLRDFGHDVVNGLRKAAEVVVEEVLEPVGHAIVDYFDGGDDYDSADWGS
jgi:hypothetical protein